MCLHHCVWVHVCLHRASHMIWVRLWRTSDRTNASYRYRVSYPMAHHPIIQLMASTQVLMNCLAEGILAKTKPQLNPPRFIISLLHKSQQQFIALFKDDPKMLQQIIYVLEMTGALSLSCPCNSSACAQLPSMLEMLNGQIFLHHRVFWCDWFKGSGILHPPVLVLGARWGSPVRRSIKERPHSDSWWPQKAWNC